MMWQNMADAGSVLFLIGVVLSTIGVISMIFQADALARVGAYGASAVIVGLLLVIPGCVMDDARHRSDFLTECGRDRKAYECEVLWHATRGSGSTQVMPLAINPAPRVP